MERLEKEFDGGVAQLVNLLQAIAESHPNLVFDIKTVIQSLYASFIQAINKVSFLIAHFRGFQVCSFP